MNQLLIGTLLLFQTLLWACNNTKHAGHLTKDSKEFKAVEQPAKGTKTSETVVKVTEKIVAEVEEEKEKENFGFVETNNETSAKLKAITTEVFQDLIRSIGRRDPTPPRLKLVADNSIVAQLTPRGEMEVGEKFVQLCLGFGSNAKNALALVLGHELGHYYGDHSWGQEYGSAYASTTWGEKVIDTDKNSKEAGIYETQADEYGLFYSYAAGYNTFGIAGEVLDKIYEVYDLPNEIPGYPSLDDRKKLAKVAGENVEKLIPIFEAGNLTSILSHIGAREYKLSILDFSSNCFEHIINSDFTSREIFNNIGVNKAYAALELFDREYLTYAYPIELDLESRLSPTPRTFGYTESERMRNAFLEEAEGYFNEARKLDKSYCPAYINLACVFDLKEKYRYALLEAEEGYTLGEKQNDEKLMADALEIWGISAANTGDKVMAQAKFKEAQKLGSLLSDHNLKILDGEKISVKREDSNAIDDLFGGALDGETVKGKAVRDIFREVGKNYDYVQQLKDRSGFVAKKDLGEGDLLTLGCKGSECKYKAIAFYLTHDDTSLTTSKGTKLGDSINKVEKAHGEPNKIITTATYNYYIYKDASLMLRFDKNNVLVRMAIYEII